MTMRIWVHSAQDECGEGVAFACAVQSMRDRMEQVSMSALPKQGEATDITEANVLPRHLSSDEARAVFDMRARELLGISGEEFKRQWEAGEITDPDRSEVIQLWMLLPWAE